MKFTNTHGLPDVLAQAIISNEHIKTGQYSVTELIAPPRVTQLKQRHDHLITRDVSSMLWMFLGTAVHSALSKVAESEPLRYLCERQMTIEVPFGLARVVVSGSCDLYDKMERILHDWKCTVSNTFVRGPKFEWEAQLNIYALMIEKFLGGERGPKKILNHLICRDWQGWQAKKEGYPKTAFPSIEYGMWTEDQTMAYLMSRVALHEMAKSLSDDLLPECSEEDRWNRNIRCAQYCEAAPFCNQWRSIQEGKDGDTKNGGNGKALETDEGSGKATSPKRKRVRKQAS